MCVAAGEPASQAIPTLHAQCAKAAARRDGSGWLRATLRIDTQDPRATMRVLRAGPAGDRQASVCLPTGSLAGRPRPGGQRAHSCAYGRSRAGRRRAGGPAARSGTSTAGAPGPGTGGRSAGSDIAKRASGTSDAPAPGAVLGAGVASPTRIRTGATLILNGPGTACAKCGPSSFLRRRHTCQWPGRRILLPTFNQTPRGVRQCRPKTMPCAF